MIFLITGASHTGKTFLAQKLLEKYRYPYLSIDHLKMGLIRSNQTTLTVFDDDKLTEYLWPIVKEMIKTAIENKQNLIVEGLYIPFDWKRYFTNEYLPYIEFICLCFSENYIQNNYDNILEYANVVEIRLNNEYSKEEMIVDNNYFLEQCSQYGFTPILIDKDYPKLV